MPLIDSPASGQKAADVTNEGEVALLDATGTKLTVESSTIASFLGTLDWNDVLDHLIDTGNVKPSEGHYTEKDGDLLESAKDAEGAELCLVETFSGADVAEVVDFDDLMEMFTHFLANEVDDSLLENKVRLATFADLFEATPFKKGDFRKGPFKGAGPGAKGAPGKAYAQRVRMMMAMLHKGAIQRVAKGKGYKGGDYKYGPNKAGTPAGVKMYTTIRKKNINNGTAAKQARTADPVRKTRVVKLIYTNLGAKMPNPYRPPEIRLKGGAKVKSGGGKSIAQKVKKAAVKASIKKNSKSNAMVSHDTEAAFHLTESGPSMSAKIMKGLGAVTRLDESAAAAKK